MTGMRRTVRRLLADDAGATAIEYALLAALIAGVIIAATMQLGQTLTGLYGGVNADLVTNMPSTATPPTTP
jgi:pilus assembly protein Flp/PilA